VPPASHETSLSREDLIGYLDEYLNALLAHDPEQLPLAPKAKFTENTKALLLGQGLWEKASAVRYRHAFADPALGQAGLFASIEEGGELSMFALRIKVAEKKISEIETIVTRKSPLVAFRPKALTRPKPIFAEVVPEAERLPRERMRAAAELYFDGLEQSSAERVPLHPDCNRMENGLKTTNNPDFGQALSLSCADQFPYFAYIARIRDRRYTIFDEERGLVQAWVVFDNPGTARTATLPGLGVIDLPERTHRPWSQIIAELFKIKNGLIYEIEAVIGPLPYGAGSGWGERPL